MLSRYITLSFSFLLSIFLLFTALPAMSNKHDFIINEADFSYIHLDQEFSPIVRVLHAIGDLDEDINSPIRAFSRCISQECAYAEYDYIINLLEYAENVLYSQYKKLDVEQACCLMSELHDVINHIFETRTAIRKTDTFDDVKIKKSLSVTDLFVANCIQNLCIQKLSATDVTIQNLTVTGSMPLNNLSIAAATVITLSVNDEVINDSLRFTDTTGGEYVGLKAPSIVPASYSLSLPSAIPTAHQVLRANYASPITMEWATTATSIDPSVTKIIYVAKRGNDGTGNGSFDFPYATLAKAITTANSIASSVNPITIAMTPGVYVENNNSGPIAITAAGISIVGDSVNGVVITPSSSTKDLLLINNTVRLSNLTLQSNAPQATGISITAGRLSVFDSVRVVNFLVGINCSGTPADTYGFLSCFFLSNGTAIVNNNASLEFNSCTIFGVNSVAIPAANTGITMTGSNARVVFDGGVCGLCATGFNINDNSFCTINSVAFRRNTYDIVQNGASHLVLSACNFELTNGSTEIDIQVSGAGTTTEIVGCEFNGDATSGVPQGIGIFVSDNAFVDMNSSTMLNYDTAIAIGFNIDTSSTMLTASGVVVRDCATDILQKGSASLSFTAGVADSSKLIINDSTNVNLAFFDSANNGALSIGSFTDNDTTLMQVEIAMKNQPKIDYKSSLYSSQAIGFENSAAHPSSFFVIAPEKSNLLGITTDRTKSASLQLLSDAGIPVGTTTALRGWTIVKNGSTAELAFNYRNSDIIGQMTVVPYTVMQLDGVNNQVQLPSPNTRIMLGGDTNLYRSSANVLQTDGSFAANMVSIGGVVTNPTDAATKAYVDSAIAFNINNYFSAQEYTVTDDNQTINAASTTSILLLSTTQDRTNFTIVFPVLPMNGQLFTILLVSDHSVGIINDGNINNGNPARIVNEITNLDASAIATASTGGAGVTYIYFAATNSWYRHSRG